MIGIEVCRDACSIGNIDHQRSMEAIELTAALSSHGRADANSPSTSVPGHRRCGNWGIYLSTWRGRS